MSERRLVKGWAWAAGVAALLTACALGAALATGHWVPALLAAIGCALSTVSVFRHRRAILAALGASGASITTMRGLTDEIPALLGVFDADERFEYANRTQQELHRRSAVELEGAHVRDVLGTTAYREIQPYIERALAGEIVHFESYFEVPSVDDPLVFDASYVPRRAPDGRVTGFYSLAFDVTERHAAERERRALQLRMLQAQKLESLGVLAGGIAHDFNNLLVTMLANVGLVRLDLEDGRNVDAELEQIEAAARQAADLCRQMLDYSGKGRAAPEPVDLSHVAREMATLLQVSLNSNVSLRFDLEHALPHVLADGSQLRQVIMNLVTNASESMAESGGFITIRTGRVAADRSLLASTFVDDDLPEGDYVFVEVVDSGCGMAPEVRASLFDPFFSTKFTGRGLGLASVLGIVRAHNGAIEVESEVDRGSRIRVLLPVDPSVDEIPDVPVVPRAVRSQRGSRVEGSESRKPDVCEGRILIVDDEPGLRRAAKRILDSAGFESTVVESGPAALEILRAGQPPVDAIVLDLTMPGMDGAETLARIRELDPGIPVLLCSGYTEDEVEARCKGLRYSGCLAKPFDYGGFVAAVRRLLER